MATINFKYPNRKADKAAHREPRVNYYVFMHGDRKIKVYVNRNGAVDGCTDKELLNFIRGRQIFSLTGETFLKPECPIKISPAFIDYLMSYYASK